jgi:hypothetical protein
LWHSPFVFTSHFTSFSISFFSYYFDFNFILLAWFLFQFDFLPLKHSLTLWQKLSCRNMFCLKIQILEFHLKSRWLTRTFTYFVALTLELPILRTFILWKHLKTDEFNYLRGKKFRASSTDEGPNLNRFGKYFRL